MVELTLSCFPVSIMRGGEGALLGTHSPGPGTYFTAPVVAAKRRHGPSHGFGDYTTPTYTDPLKKRPTPPPGPDHYNVTPRLGNDQVRGASGPGADCIHPHCAALGVLQMCSPCQRCPTTARPSLASPARMRTLRLQHITYPGLARTTPRRHALDSWHLQQ